MRPLAQIKERIFDQSADFLHTASDVFQYQRASVAVFRSFIDNLSRPFDNITHPASFPFLPIEFYRSHTVLSEGRKAELYFESSGTTSENNSRHYLADAEIYHTSIVQGFESFYGPVQNHVFYALLPSYLERKHASLVHMSKHLMDVSGSKGGGFYRYDYNKLVDDISNDRGSKTKVLIGVTFALLELAETEHSSNLSDVIILETGGMKGRRKEIIREELHDILNNGFGTDAIHSEYGMTELLSQAYSKGDGRFHCPPWMKVVVRDPYDPLNVTAEGKGALNIIDLANLYSCSFIATNDIGEVFEDGSFKVSGRLDNSRLRGCSLMFDG